jgi:7 transmembrane sweet-taste receptor of 3 GCPR
MANVILLLLLVLMDRNLLAKTYRIFKIFSNIRVTRGAIKDIDLLLFTGGLLILEVALLLIWTVPFGTPTPTFVFSSSDPLYAYITCEVSNDTFQGILIAVILSVNGVLVFVAAAFAYLTRHVDSAYSESKSITIIVSLPRYRTYVKLTINSKCFRCTRTLC